VSTTTTISKAAPTRWDIDYGETIDQVFEFFTNDEMTITRNISGRQYAMWLRSKHGETPFAKLPWNPGVGVSGVSFVTDGSNGQIRILITAALCATFPIGAYRSDLRELTNPAVNFPSKFHGDILPTSTESVL